MHRSSATAAQDLFERLLLRPKLLKEPAVALHRIMRKLSQQSLHPLSLLQLHWERFRLPQAKALPWLRWFSSLRRCGLACIYHALYEAVSICVTLQCNLFGYAIHSAASAFAECLA